MKSLSAKANKHAALVAEIERLRKKETDLEAEEKQALDNGSLEDSETFKRISDIRLMREIIPRKNTQLEAQSEAMEAELRAENVAAARQFIEIAGKEKAALRLTIFKFLRELAGDLREDDRLTDEVLHRSDAFRNRIAHLETSISRYDNIHTTPSVASQVLLALAAKHGIA